MKRLFWSLLQVYLCRNCELKLLMISSREINFDIKKQVKINGCLALFINSIKKLNVLLLRIL